MVIHLFGNSINHIKNIGKMPICQPKLCQCQMARSVEVFLNNRCLFQCLCIGGALLIIIVEMPTLN